MPQFPVIPLFPWISEFHVFFLIHTILCLGLEGTKNPSLTEERSDWQLSSSSSSLSPLPLFSNNSSYSFSTCLSLFYFPFFSSLYFSSPVSFSNCPFVFCPHPFFCPLFSAYSYSVSHVLSLPPSISCSQTVLHGQFTKSGIHSPFSPRAFNTIFNTKAPKAEKLKKESRERERERTRKGDWKTWKKKELDLKSIKSVFAAWTGEMEVYSNTEGYVCALLTWLEL